MHSGDFPGALASFTQAIEKDPACARAYMEKGLLLHLSGDIPGVLLGLNLSTDLLTLKPCNFTTFVAPIGILISPQYLYTTASFVCYFEN